MDNKIEPKIEITLNVKKAGKVICSESEVIEHAKQHNDNKG